MIKDALSKWGLSRLEGHMPAVFRVKQIQVLADLAADSFGCRRIRIRSRKPARALREYAEFTVSCMERQQADPARLFCEAARLGRRIRRLSGLRDPVDRRRLVFLLYHGIDIDMSGELPGEVIVSSCFFSRYYTPAQCELMSFVDSGIVSGIMGGGKLRFSRRITEGCDSCAARLCGRCDRL